MPLADRGAVVSLVVKDLGKSDLFRQQTNVVRGTSYVVDQPEADGIAAREQSATRCGTDAGTRIETGESDTLGGHSVEVGRRDQISTVRPGVAIAEIVSEYEHDVGRRFSS